MIEKPQSRRLAPPRAANLTRRRLIQWVGASSAPWALNAGAAPPNKRVNPAAAPGAEPLEAYADRCSVAPGETLRFAARDPAASGKTDVNYSAAVVRLGMPDETVWTGTVSLRNRSVPAKAATQGCGWPTELSLVVPDSWASGLYYAAFGSGERACLVPFVVRAAVRTASVMVQIAVTTAQAYNSYGGKSLYGYNSTGGVPATQVSFDRPFDNQWNYAFDEWQGSFVRWLAKSGIAADFCASTDLHRNAAVLNGYALMVTVGHDEYWSRPMRERLDNFVAAGGNAAVLSGNTCWWQVRFANNSSGQSERTMICYKSRSADPESREAYKTVNWVDLVPPDPENRSIGLGWKLGASWVNALPRPYTPFVLQRAEHWAFAGTGMAQGAAFAGEFVGYEIDALEFRSGTDSRPYPTGNDGTPYSLRVLALADASTWDAQAKVLGLGGEKSGYGAISVHSRGGAAGTVFNAGATDWTLALKPELDGQMPGVVGIITRNVLNKLSLRHRESADVRQWQTPQANGDGTRHFYSTASTGPSGASLDGLVFRAWLAPSTDTAPVYRFRMAQANGDGSRYMLSLSAAVGSGWVLEGVVFHAHASAVAGTVPVYQHHVAQANGDGWRFLYSSRPNEAGWVLDGVAFYAPAV